MNRNISKALWTLGSLVGAQQAAKFARSVGGVEWNDILGVVGLERRPSAFSRALPALGLVAVSAAVGAGAALLLAPSSGEELRARLSDGLDDVKNRLDDVKGRVNEKINDKIGAFEQHHTSNSTS
ncbi:MAG TPA: YtxH domain-containing protein [Polyangiaceae bacterium]|nr:YtxH domain-containing protein [Polyangiaceae bacterium]